MDPLTSDTRGRPQLTILDDFLSETDLERIDRLTEDLASLEAAGIGVQRDSTGLSCELPLEWDDVLAVTAQRIEAATGLRNHFGPTLRYRHYAVGDSHPLHLDAYRIGDLHLVATAILYLCDTESGGETVFPEARPEPIRIAPRRGRLAIWHNYRADGAPDPASRHEGRRVLAGHKRTLTAFIYQPRASAARSAVRFACIDDGVPEETTDFLRMACAQRDVEYVAIDPRAFDFRPERRLVPGDLLYRPAVSPVAMLVEQFLHVPGVGTFYRGDDRIHFVASGSSELYRLAGLPVPASLACSTSDRDWLRDCVDRLGGFPVVAKFGGGEGGVGVVRMDSYPALFSVVDFALSQGRVPQISRFIREAMHWRVVVVGERAVAAYRNPLQTDDFRSYASDDPADVTDAPENDLAELAVRAVAALQLEFGGVDILRGADGALYLLETNFPCYFAHAQRVAGLDVAGAMIDHLLAKVRVPGR